MQPRWIPPIQYEVGEATLERQTRIRPLTSCIATRAGGFSVVTYSMRSAGNRVARARVDRQLAGTMESTATEAPCAMCRGVGLITAEFHDALAGDQDAASRHGGILRGAN
eukprot:991338-Pyramimonas_sp.AAC.2